MRPRRRWSPTRVHWRPGRPRSRPEHSTPGQRRWTRALRWMPTRSRPEPRRWTLRRPRVVLELAVLLELLQAAAVRAMMPTTATPVMDLRNMETFRTGRHLWPTIDDDQDIPCHRRAVAGSRRFVQQHSHLLPLARMGERTHVGPDITTGATRRGWPLGRDPSAGGPRRHQPRSHVVSPPVGSPAAVANGNDFAGSNGCGVCSQQAVRCVPATANDGGCSVAQIVMAKGHLGWKRHPVGGFTSDGGAPEAPEPGLLLDLRVGRRAEQQLRVRVRRCIGDGVGRTGSPPPSPHTSP